MLGRAIPFLVLSTTAVASAQAADSANFKRCLSSETHCDMRRLTAQQRQRVFERAQRDHLESCLAGRMCNRAALTPDEQGRVQTAVAQLNFRACLAGQADCRIEGLTPDQHTEVERAERARHLERCLAGLTGCDETRLDPAQLDQVRGRASERNYALCLQGAFVECRERELSAAQRANVDHRRRAANLFLCTYSLVGCVPDLLTQEERAQVAAARPGLLR